MTIELTEQSGRYSLTKTENGKICCGFITRNLERLTKKYREWLHREQLKQKLNVN